MSSASLPEPVEVVRVRDLLDRLVAANETHLRSRPRLIALPFPEELTLKELVTTKPRTVRFAVPEEALDGCDEHEFWGWAEVNLPSGRSMKVLLVLAWESPGGDPAAEDFRRLAIESGRLYQTLPPCLAPVHGTTSPRNLWASVLYGWLWGSPWVCQHHGFDSIPLPFGASAELWRRLLYGTTPDGKVGAGACTPPAGRTCRANLPEDGPDPAISEIDFDLTPTASDLTAFRETDRTVEQEKGDNPDPPRAPSIDTTPDSPPPPEGRIRAAMRDIPPAMADMDNTREYGASAPAPGQRVVLHHRLVRELCEKRRHGKAAAEWAIHRLVRQGLLTARYGRASTPGAAHPGGGWAVAPVEHEVKDLKYSLIESTQRLWKWWHMSEKDERRGSEGQPSPAPHRPPLPSPETIESDIDAAHRAVVECLAAAGSLREAALLSMRGAPVTAAAAVAIMYRLDAAVIRTEHLDTEGLFGRDSAHESVIRTACSAVAAFRQGVADFRNSGSAPSEGWVDLWETYAERFHVYFNYWGLSDEPPEVTIDADRRGDVVYRITYEQGPRLRPDHPWHPHAWSWVCRRVAALQPWDPDRLTEDLEREAADARARRAAFDRSLFSDLSRHPAARLVSAIDTLCNYATTRADRDLTREERAALEELDGTVFGLATALHLPVAAAPEPNEPGLRFLGHTGIPYTLFPLTPRADTGSGPLFGMRLTLGGPWESKMRSLRATAEALAGCLGRAAGGEGSGRGDDPAPEPKRPRRMSAKEVNEAAMRLAERMGREFFLLSEREQAKRIGCSWATWKKTPFFNKAQEKKLRTAERIANGRGAGSPAVYSLTDRILAITGTSDRKKILRRQEKDAELRRLVAEQLADYEPSPLEDDPPASRPKQVRSHKQL